MPTYRHLITSSQPEAIVTLDAIVLVWDLASRPREVLSLDFRFTLIIYGLWLVFHYGLGANILTYLLDQFNPNITKRTVFNVILLIPWNTS